MAGTIAERVLQDLHVRLALVSATGISLETGLTDGDIDQVQVKARMIASADTVVALIDSSKFGRRNLSSFSRIDQVARIFTDDDLAPSWIDQIQQTSITLTVCGAETVTSFRSARRCWSGCCWA